MQVEEAVDLLCKVIHKVATSTMTINKVQVLIQMVATMIMSLIMVVNIIKEVVEVIEVEVEDVIDIAVVTKEGIMLGLKCHLLIKHWSHLRSSWICRGIICR